MVPENCCDLKHQIFPRRVRTVVFYIYIEYINFFVQSSCFSQVFSLHWKPLIILMEILQHLCVHKLMKSVQLECTWSLKQKEDASSIHRAQGRRQGPLRLSLEHKVGGKTLDICIHTPQRIQRCQSAQSTYIWTGRGNPPEAWGENAKNHLHRAEVGIEPPTLELNH